MRKEKAKKDRFTLRSTQKEMENTYYARKSLYGRRGTMDDRQDRKPHRLHAVRICTRSILQTGRNIPLRQGNSSTL